MGRLDVLNLSVHYSDFSLKDVSFSCNAGEIVALVGKNGAGKTATLDSIMGLVHRDAGKVIFTFIIFPMLGYSLLLPKTCYMDDSIHTRKFLASLPVKTSCLVGAKYLLALICAVAAIALTSLSATMPGFRVLLQSVLIAFIYMLLYPAVFLFVFHQMNYSHAEQANAAFLVLFMISVLSISRSAIDLDAIVLPPVLLASAVLAAMSVFAIFLHRVCCCGQAQPQAKVSLPVFVRS